MPISVLAPDIAAKIAAGEVVERPASVVKELVENALDAGATRISIEIEAGGTRLIRVADDGCGIPRAEVELAFARHATSKLASENDLGRITTLGFRGEALPSIAAVARVSILTRTADEAGGSHLELVGGAVAARETRSCPIGTTIAVRDLFSTLPARRKFLKSAPTEAGHITQIVTQYTLAYPEVKFNLAHDGRSLVATPGNGSLGDVIVQVYGLEVAEGILELAAAENATPRVWGFVSSPSVSRATRGYLSFFVNRRWVQSRMLAFAVEEAYQGLLMTGRHPVAVINLAVPPSEVDVNIHPAKTEVRFLNEREAFAAVQRAVRAAIVDQAPVPTFHVNTQTRPGSGEVAASISLFSPEASLTAEKSRGRPEGGLPELLPERLPALRPLGQINSTYIVAEGPEGMYLVDQHAAHERVLYEKVRAQRAAQQMEVQGLLEPLVLDITLAQEAALESGAELLAAYGFQVEPFGAGCCLVRAAPAALAAHGLRDALLEILDGGSGAGTDAELDRVAMSVACHGSVRAGQSLSLDEMRELLRALEQTSSPRTCPHGRPTMLHLSAAQLESQFGRRG